MSLADSMSKIPTNQISAYSNRGQGVVLVLFALHTLGGSNSKREVIDHISRSGWYEVTRHDLPPYENQNEPKYHTLLAWARKDCYQKDWLLPTDSKDDWSISRSGRSVLDKNIRRYQAGELSVRKCYLWKPNFQNTKLSNQAFKNFFWPNCIFRTRNIIWIN